MAFWLKRFFKRETPRKPLRGAPQVRREKAYSADTGYVYQYFYEGYRDAERAGDPGREYVFDVTSDRASRFPVTVFLSRRAIEAWRQAHRSELSPTEQYAVVKMSLFQTFDERTDFGGTAVDVVVSAADIETHTATLELD